MLPTRSPPRSPFSMKWRFRPTSGSGRVERHVASDVRAIHRATSTVHGKSRDARVRLRCDTDSMLRRMGDMQRVAVLALSDVPLAHRRHAGCAAALLTSACRSPSMIEGDMCSQRILSAISALLVGAIAILIAQ
jgi:hypothetical protein